MKTLFFKGKINDDNISELIIRIEEIREETDEKIVIYFTSEGGAETSANILVDYSELNDLSDVEFVIYWQLDSAAFDLMYRIKCKKRIINGAFSCIHSYAMDLNTREEKQQTEFLLKSLKRSNSRVINDFKNFLTEKELQAFENQEDVYLCDERLRLILC